MNDKDQALFKSILEAAYADYCEFCKSQQAEAAPYQQFVDMYAMKIYHDVTSNAVVAIETESEDNDGPRRPLYMARRVAGPPVMPAEKGKCVQCSHDVWLDVNRKEQQAMCDVVCNVCVGEMTGGISHAEIMNMFYTVLGIAKREKS